ncbi:Pao retrotransposon peptidase [Nesidiocoris tenuis]|uniref:Pao retrotransposon peptidase n=2 Tax=Nesidiocoris tenuis TaxID=355587 RepID=A0ABN7AAA5_9HEMI|nr:Pao retrotransposon peptidase [Nesidiocoris tenuis]
MGVIDDYAFTTGTLTTKVERIAVAAATYDADPTEKNKRLFMVMAERLDEFYTTFHDTIAKINTYNSRNGIEEDLEAAINRFEGPYYASKASVLAITGDRDRDRRRSLDEASNVANRSSVQAAPQIQLPTLKLPVFSGDLRTWQNFTEVFRASVHNNLGLSDIQRHAYLRAGLAGEALSLVAALPLTAQNYSVCWDTLAKRYDHTHLITNAHLETLFDLPRTADNATSIRAFAAKIMESLGALAALEHEVAGWAVPLLFLLCRKLHTKLRISWERRVVEEPLPTISYFVDFLNEQARIMEVACPSAEPSLPRRTDRGSTKGRGTPERRAMAFAIGSNVLACPRCSANHNLEDCGEFRRSSPRDRLHFIRSKKLCLACLRTAHFAGVCPRQSPCKHCNQRHHSLLHLNQTRFGPSPGTPSERPGTSPPTSSETTTAGANGHALAMRVKPAYSKGRIIIATAIAQVLGGDGKYHPTRIMIDPGSEADFIRRACVHRLRLKSRPAEVPLVGLSNRSLGVCREYVDCHFQPAKGVEINTQALIIDDIGKMPSVSSPQLPSDMVANRPLADERYFLAADVDILLGAQWFPYILIGEPILGTNEMPSLIPSIWGHLVIGKYGMKVATQTRAAFVRDDSDVGAILHRFWEIEEPPVVEHLSSSDQECEDLYCRSVKRQPDGRYVVALPLSSQAQNLGISRPAALRRFLSLERRLNQDRTLREQYHEFMEDYLGQGHMVPAPGSPPDGNQYYIPHHCIFRRDSKGSVSKFRVVFDSSMKTLNGPSLNEVVHKGQKLQADIVDILVRFRFFEVILIADVRQMYRNIRIYEEHQDFQRILWRFNAEDPIQEFKLTTVTYGVSCSPFLAIRTLHQLVQDEGGPFPLASAAIMHDTFMDDVVKSVPSIAEALELQQQLQNLMNLGQFELRKWRSNRPAVLQQVPEEHRAKDDFVQSFENENEPTAKILGLIWRSTDDTFGYQIASVPRRITKRSIMSEIAKIYDPIGFLCPVIFLGKCMLRHLWQLGVDWDEPLPSEICQRWERFQAELQSLHSFTLPRCLGLDQVTSVQLHAFADSSEKGYAGVVYLRTESISGQVKVSLMMAKSKVAPVKSCSLPRLELCGILLAARLVQRISSLIRPACPIQSSTVWTDSMVALHWVTSPPHRWKTFVANRVSSAQQLVAAECYRHVPTTSNPADCASRGLLPSEILQHSMWLTGPTWLAGPSKNWPCGALQGPHNESEVEARVSTFMINLTVAPSSLFNNLLSRLSSYSRLLRVVAWMHRGVENWISMWKGRVRHLHGHLTLKELDAALVTCVKWTQEEAFAGELDRLRHGKPATQELRRLSPFLDSQGIIRVGGRLKYAELSTNRKHPIVLPRKHKFTLMVIEFYHQIHLYPGLSTLHSIIRQSFWIVAGRAAIYSQISKCLRCFRTNPTPTQPPMADLPFDRVNPGRPFEVTGVDYGGPFYITMARTRKPRILKAYLCIFICFKIKAVHLELVSELTTEAFLAALTRFKARRPSVSVIHSDCGTNFVGAKRKLEEWARLSENNDFINQVSHFTTARRIDWRLNPPASPHFGGIWEANIKSAKRLLARAIGQQVLTYEELSTVLCQVEATLNSRPLVPMSNDPRDLEALTPAHFLCMEPPVALPEPEVDTHRSLRDRWALLRGLTQSFWKRWSADYLNTLQQRNKWTRPAPPLTKDMLVVLKEENAPPLSWRLGRIINTFPGGDGLVRVVEVKTAHGVVRRAAAKVCPLPIE